MASLTIRDAQGRVYPSQAKRLAPDFSFHPQIYRADGEIGEAAAGGIHGRRHARPGIRAARRSTLKVGGANRRCFRSN